MTVPGSALLMQVKSSRSKLTLFTYTHWLAVRRRLLSVTSASYKHIHVTDSAKSRDSGTPNAFTDDTPIHYIWSYENLRDLEFFDVSSSTPVDSPDDPVPYYIHERWALGLRLATMLLERARPSLERVMFAPVLHPTSPDTFAFPALAHKWRPNAVSSLTFESELKNLARIFRIYRCPPEHPSHPGKDFCGATKILAASARQTTIIYSGIQDVMFPMVARFYFDQRPIEEQRIVFLVLAVMLLHELAHAIKFRRYLGCINLKGGCGLPIGSLEPAYRPQELLRELCLRLEIEPFGGEIQFALALDANGARYLSLMALKG